MKKLIALFFVATISTNALAVIKCVPDGRGGSCCWDVNKDGPWKPIMC